MFNSKHVVLYCRQYTTCRMCEYCNYLLKSYMSYMERCMSSNYLLFRFAFSCTSKIHRSDFVDAAFIGSLFWITSSLLVFISVLNVF